MTERKKIGVRVDAALWERFRENVKDRKGQTRGVLGDEVENALREYIHAESSPTEERIEKRLSRIERAVGAAPTDGGTDTFEAPEHTHTQTPTPTEKPAPNTSTDKKVAWLAECVRDQLKGDFQEAPRTLLVETVKDEYGFRSDTAKRYVERLIDHFDLRPHPFNDTVYVTDEQHEKLVEKKREQVEADQ